MIPTDANPFEAIPLEDRGFTLGDGLFETLLVEDGVVRFWAEHIARMAAGCAALGLPTPDATAIDAAAMAALAGLEGRLALRITVTAGGGGRGLDRPAAPVPRIVATAAPAPSPIGPAALATSTVRRNEGSPASRLKTLSYLDNVLARAEAQRSGADEAMMLNTRGEVACAAAGNLFWVSDGRLFTPALDCGVLEGIMRRQVMAAVETAEVRADGAALAAAEAVFLTNSLVGVRAISMLDGRTFGPHPLVERLASLVG